MTATPFRLATAQLPISGDVGVNAGRVRASMREAAAQGTRLVHFPEGMLSGYAKNPIQDWTEVDWGTVREELELAMALAAELRLWVVLGSAHPLTPPHWPHNSLYVISDQGQLPLLAISPLVKQLPGIRAGQSRQENWATIVELLGEGRIRPVVDQKMFPLEQAAEAIDYLALGGAKGRVVLTV